MSKDVDSGDHIHLIRSNSSNSEPDLEAPGSKKSGITGLLKQLDRRMSGRRPSRRHHDGGLEPFDRPPLADALGDGAPPEWALLLIGSLLGLATGLCVAAFNHGMNLNCSYYMGQMQCSKSSSSVRISVTVFLIGLWAGVAAIF